MASGQHFFGVPSESSLNDHWSDAEGASTSFSNQLVQIVPEVPAILRGMSMVLVVLAIKVLIALRGLSHHLIRPPKVWLILDFL